MTTAINVGWPVAAFKVIFPPAIERETATWLSVALQASD